MTPPGPGSGVATSNDAATPAVMQGATGPLTLREGSTSNVKANGVTYGKFGLRHIRDKHVGKGEKSA